MQVSGIFFSFEHINYIGFPDIDGKCACGAGCEGDTCQCHDSCSCKCDCKSCDRK